MKQTAKDPRKTGFPIDKEYNSIQDLVVGSDLMEDDMEKPYIDNEGRTHVYLKSISKKATCPYCGHESTSHHGITKRNSQLIPLNGLATVGHLRLYRYYCDNPLCKAGTFTEEIPDLSPYRQNNDIVLNVVFAIFIFCSASATERICKQIGIQISHDTIGRLCSNIIMEDDSDAEKIGVDDVSMRRGVDYNTVIYDALTHVPIALFKGRDGKNFRSWLENHKKIDKVARDRASAYASAIKDVLDDCVQVADRFHILQNLLDRLKDIFKTSIPDSIYIDQNGNVLDMPEKDIKSGLISHVNSSIYGELEYNNDPIIGEDGDSITVLATPDTDMHAERRLQKMQRVMELREELSKSEKPNYSALSKKYDMSTVTIKKYSKWTDEQVASICNKRRYSKPDCPMNQYDNIVYKMLKDGIMPDEVYCRIIANGYDGSLTILQRHINGIAYNHMGIEVNRHLGTDLSKAGVEVVKRNDIIKYVTIKDKKRMEGTTVNMYFDTIVARYPSILRLVEIWNDGHSMVMGGNAYDVDVFITKYKGSEISSFVTGLELDIEAVKNGVTDEMNSGFVEGNNCKYKLTQRIMYGKAPTTTLMKKFYVSSKICQCEITISDILQLKTPRKYYSRRPLRISC